MKPHQRVKPKSRVALKEGKQEQLPPPVEVLRPFSFFPFTSFKVPALLLALLAVALYANTLFHGYALDDGIVIINNSYVQEGISGIGKILSSDAYESFYKSMGAEQQLTGGRYRPLSIVAFAIEKQLFSDNLFWGHFFNILFYALSVVLLFYLLYRYVFPALPDVAFLSALLFTLHPIHTEVVANIKSRDEIFSLLFIISTFIFFFRYFETKRAVHMFGAAFLYFMALLSKEYAIVLVLLAPAFVYVARKKDVGEMILPSLALVGVAILYLVIRISVVGASQVESKELLNNPYLLASAQEKLATKIFILIKYLWLLIFPHPLSSDYSYRQIAYRTFADAEVWISLFAHIALVAAGLRLFLKRHILSLAILVYLAFLALVGNIFFDIGATMGERLIYHSSVGFCMAAGYLIIRAVEKVSNPKVLLYPLVTIIAVAYSIRTVSRNVQWKDDHTLFTHDVKVSPNSVLINGNAGSSLINKASLPENEAQRKEMITTAFSYLHNALSIHPGYVNGWLNLGVGHYYLGNYDSTVVYWQKAEALYPNHPLLMQFKKLLARKYYEEGIKLAQEKKDFEAAQEMIERSVAIDSSDANVLYDLGGIAFTARDYNTARTAWEKALRVDPAHEKTKEGMRALGVEVK